MLQMGWVTCTINDYLESHSKSSATFGVFTQFLHMKLLSPEGLNNIVINNKGSSWGEGFKWGEGRLSDSFTANFVSASQTKVVATLTWPNVGVKPNTWKSWGFGVLRDSRTFRARQQDPKHLALGCFWCHWKGPEA
jgi:hypothetical protein